MTNQTQMLRRWNLKHNWYRKQCHPEHCRTKLHDMIASKAEEIENLEEKENKLVNENNDLENQVERLKRVASNIHKELLRSKPNKS